MFSCIGADHDLAGAAELFNCTHRAKRCTTQVIALGSRSAAEYCRFVAGVRFWEWRAERELLLYEAEPVGDEAGKHIRVQHNDDADNRRQRYRVPHHEAKDHSFICRPGWWPRSPL